VEQREQELSAAQVALAYARARLARAEGKLKLAAAEWRKVLRHREGHLKAVEQRYARGVICSPEPLQEARGAVAVARARLAEADGKRGDLRAELPKVIAYHEWRIQRFQALLRKRVIAEKEAQAALKASETELRWARGCLASMRGDSAKLPKTGKGCKP
jgi:hypothetical protein